jgi:hypothetical protein
MIYEFLLTAALWWLKTWFSFRLLKFGYIFMMSIYGHFFARPVDLNPFKNRWTVVTGCTDGIGRAYIEELCISRGIRKFFLIARNQKKLDRVVRELSRLSIMIFKKEEFRGTVWL